MCLLTFEQEKDKYQYSDEHGIGGKSSTKNSGKTGLPITISGKKSEGRTGSLNSRDDALDVM